MDFGEAEDPSRGVTELLAAVCSENTSVPEKNQTVVSDGTCDLNPLEDKLVSSDVQVSVESESVRQTISTDTLDASVPVENQNVVSDDACDSNPLEYKISATDVKVSVESETVQQTTSIEAPDDSVPEENQNVISDDICDLVPLENKLASTDIQVSIDSESVLQTISTKTLDASVTEENQNVVSDDICYFVPLEDNLASTDVQISVESDSFQQTISTETLDASVLVENQNVVSDDACDSNPLEYKLSATDVKVNVESESVQQTTLVETPDENQNVTSDDAYDLNPLDDKIASTDVQVNVGPESVQQTTSIEELGASPAKENKEQVYPYIVQEPGEESAASVAACGERGVLDHGFTLEDMQRLQKKFAEEAFNFLLRNAQIWTEYPKNFAARHNHTGCCMTFTHDVGKAIIMIAYIYRVEYRKKFRKCIHEVKDVEDYKKIVMNFPIHKDGPYFFHFLSWVAFTFDFTIYCLKAGRDFVDEGRRCLERYPDLEYFHSRGGWGELLEVSYIMADMYDDFSTVVSRELPSDDTLLPFLAVVEMIDRSKRRSGKCNRVTPEMRMLRQVRQRLLNKYEVISSLDPRRVTRGFKVRMKKSPVKEKPLEELCPKAAELLKKYSVKKSPEKREIDELVEKIERTRIAVELTDRLSNSEDEAKAVERPKETKQEKSVFIINERFLEKRTMRKESPKKKRGLKVFSPSKQDLLLSMNLNEILDENIENKNYCKLNDDVYLVCPPGCDIKDEDARVIVLDTSSEEEDDDDGNEELKSTNVAEAVMKLVRKSKIQQSEEVSVAVDLAKDPETRPVSPLKTSEVKTHPPKYTGAIPKIRIYPQHVPRTGNRTEETEFAPSEFDPNNNSEITPQNRPPRRRKRSKK